MNTQRCFVRYLLAPAVAAVALPIRSHADISLFDYAFQQDGVVETAPAALPAGSVFDLAAGLGKVQMTFAGDGPHSALFFVDHELSESVNTFFNEVGFASGTPPPAGLSWEIDEPGYTVGDIYDNFLADSLDNTVGIDSAEDVSMALGWSFLLVAGDTATVEFNLGTTPPAGFFLRHLDPESGEAVYFSTSLTIHSQSGPVPEGSTAIAGLVSLGLVLARYRLRSPRC
ncbi:MAG: hypothetical protein JNK85_28470 [Verrucomicrobiales bacterium]|nr:hypothetical protein [Verrucomicrobiales bacterium]